MVHEVGQYPDSDSPIPAELERELDKIYARHHLAQESQDLIRCLGPGDSIEVFHSAGEPSYPGTVISNDGNTIVIDCSLFNDPGEGNLEFDVETACSREFIDDPDGPFYFEFAIPKPFTPNIIDISSIYELTSTTQNQPSIPDLVALKEYIRQAFVTLLKENLSIEGSKALLKTYMKQLKKGDRIKFGLRNSSGELLNSSLSPYFTAFDGVVASNNGIKVRIDSKSYQNKIKKVGRRSFDITTGESSGPAGLVGDGHGLCFYFIEVPYNFLPDTFMKIIELGPENLTILSEKRKDTFMDFPF